jgi:hypothetical protein
LRRDAQAEISVGGSLGAGCAEDVFFEVDETCVNLGVLYVGQLRFD